MLSSDAITSIVMDQSDLEHFDTESVYARFEVNFSDNSLVTVRDVDNAEFFNTPTFAAPLPDDNIQYVQCVPISSIALTIPVDSRGQSTSSNSESLPKELCRPLSSSMTRCKDPDKLNITLSCEWNDCTFSVDNDVPSFLEHVAQHASKYAENWKSRFRRKSSDTSEKHAKAVLFKCLWRDCKSVDNHGILRLATINQKLTGKSSNMSNGLKNVSDMENDLQQTVLIDEEDVLRHVNFHSYHTKIKATGTSIVQSLELPGCGHSSAERNVLPVTIEPMICEWQGCSLQNKEMFEAQRFYWHVEEHCDKIRNKSWVCGWKNCHTEHRSLSRLKEHLRAHAKERVVACPQCGVMFSNRSRYYSHCRESVQTVKEHECSLCLRRYATESRLKLHLTSHVNTIQCPHCKLSLVSQSKLNSHIAYKHSDDRPLACTYCDYRAKFPRELVSHLKRHFRKPRACDECDEKFLSDVRLKEHVDIVHRNKRRRYCCHLCTKRYNRGSNLTKHLLNFHAFEHPLAQPASDSIMFDEKIQPKFRYVADSDGYYHLRTTRIEMIDSNDNHENESRECDTPPSPLFMADDEME